MTRTISGMISGAAKPTRSFLPKTVYLQVKFRSGLRRYFVSAQSSMSFLPSKADQAVPCGTALLFAVVALLSFTLTYTASAATTSVRVQEDDPHFAPLMANIHIGDTITWIWSDSLNHSVISGDGNTGTPDGLFNSDIHRAPFTFSVTFQNVGTFFYYCGVHRSSNDTGVWPMVNVTPATPTPSPTPAGSAQPINISTRMNVQTGDQVLIGGFIITGAAPKKVMLRAIGPSLAAAGVLGSLADPVLELHAKDGSLLLSNDNWRETQQAEIEATGIPPTSDFESAIVTTLAPDNYTAVVSGKNSTSGVGLVEGYDLDQAADSQLANISTRGFIEAGSNVMIGGFILGGGDDSANVLVRALGPSLTQAGISGVLADPTLELHDANGILVQSNDNWKDTQQTEIEATGIPPSNDLESALSATLSPAAYTAIVAGKNDTTGVGLVEVYRLP